ncbi:hypothetical protein ASPTUDRAFT_676694 [Aspergillus tubingensis CBS 134.48]|uniref:Secreted protein n=1 Tax=Aspergillus tubingensis (strain CBS 134.48) TaxID=767770 RepID=A0A1L9MZV5_ASPTC|nr:hypothetical protein ASPTUDRAFT_676694 [Aspergillus tubingensis CBS 134.48]
MVWFWCGFFWCGGKAERERGCGGGFTSLYLYCMDDGVRWAVGGPPGWDEAHHRRQQGGSRGWDGPTSGRKVGPVVAGERQAVLSLATAISRQPVDPFSSSKRGARNGLKKNGRG